jgi:hypothetical protein
MIPLSQDEAEKIILQIDCMQELPEEFRANLKELHYYFFEKIAKLESKVN